MLLDNSGRAEDGSGEDKSCEPEHREHFLAAGDWSVTRSWGFAEDNGRLLYSVRGKQSDLNETCTSVLERDPGDVLRAVEGNGNTSTSI